MLCDFLQISPRISVAPVIHGSGDFAIELRRIMLSHEFDCLAVPLPGSFQDAVEQGINHLPLISVAIQQEAPSFQAREWTGDVSDDEEDRQADQGVSYVPIDPCQPVISALRIAVQEHIPRAFIDLETDRFETHGVVLPDAYAL